MNVAVYARVSTVGKGQDPETQLRPLREYCQRMGWDATEFIDHASGFKGPRPQFEAMMAQLKRKAFDTLLVWKLDRLARSVRQLIDVVHGELEPRGIQFVSLTEGFDSTTPGGRMLFHVMAALAEFEHDLISERVKAGVARKLAEGGQWGRKPLAITSCDVKEALRQHGDVSKAARALGCSRKYIYAMLKKEGLTPHGVIRA